MPDQSTIPLVFDPEHLRRNRDRGALADPSHRFLIDWCTIQLAERLELIRRRFPLALQIGALASEDAVDRLQQTGGVDTLIRLDPALNPLSGQTGLKLQATPDMLPLADQSVDLVFSPFLLHTINDLPGALAQIRRVLKPDGLLIAAMAGGETLYQLRQCLMEAELALRGGASPRIFPFADKPQMGALLQRTGFALPVIDSEKVTVTYETIFKLMRDVRLMGEGNAVAARDKFFPGKALFLEAARLYAERFAAPDGRLEATFEIIFLLGWCPHESQQKPLRPGQATIRLADALGVEEKTTGEKATP